MEVDEKKPQGSDQINPKFSINVLQPLKSAQMRHGLRHGDYTRYRSMMLDYSSLPYFNFNLFVNSNGDHFPKKQREVAEAHERILLLESLEKCLKLQNAEAAAVETHPQTKKLARYKYPTMDKTLGNFFRLHVVEGETSG